ncbi:MAG: hypothetical protein NVS3B20_05950 [Polyangiales bacterium]
MENARVSSPLGAMVPTSTSSHAGGGHGGNGPSNDPADEEPSPAPTGPLRDVAIDWEALEDAFENNAPEVHSYLQLGTGEVIRVVDGVADPHMHARIAADTGYLRVDPVSSREQYRWMERFIPMVEETELRGRLNQAIDGKGAFRRFKDVLMTHAEERERWFTYRSERLKTFMDAWLTAHSLRATPRPAWVLGPGELAPPSSSASSSAPSSSTSVGEAAPVSSSSATRDAKRKNAESLRRQLPDAADALGPRDLDALCSIADFLRARRAIRAHRGIDSMERQEGEVEAPPSSSLRSQDGSAKRESGEVP